MSLNWVMLAPAANPPYTPLPNEQTLFTSPPRIAFALSTPAHYPGKQQTPFHLAQSSGVLYLTNRRIIYLPDKATDTFQSFAAPILNLHDSHVSAPFFGPNVWVALLQPVPGGGIPVPGSTGVVELKLTFKEGGAFDFHTKFEQVKERLQHAVDVSRFRDDGAGSSRAAMNGVDVSNVNLEDLPVYQERSDGPLISPVVGAGAVTGAVTTPPSAGADSEAGPDHHRRTPAQPKPTDRVPAEPPPAYEEAQMQGVQDEVERRLSAGRGGRDDDGSSSGFD